jgi:hypothetical protein
VVKKASVQHKQMIIFGVLYSKAGYAQGYPPRLVLTVSDACLREKKKAVVGSVLHGRAVMADLHECMRFGA